MVARLNPGRWPSSLNPAGLQRNLPSVISPWLQGMTRAQLLFPGSSLGICPFTFFFTIFKYGQLCIATEQIIPRCTCLKLHLHSFSLMFSVGDGFRSSFTLVILGVSWVKWSLDLGRREVFFTSRLAPGREEGQRKTLAGEGPQCYIFVFKWAFSTAFPFYRLKILQESFPKESAKWKILVKVSYKVCV